MRPERSLSGTAMSVALALCLVNTLYVTLLVTMAGASSQASHPTRAARLHSRTPPHPATAAKLLLP